MKDFIESVLQEQGYDIHAHPGELLGEHVGRCHKYFDKIDDEKNLRAVVERYTKGKEDLSEEYLTIVWQMFTDIIDFHDIGKMTPEFQRIKMKNPHAPDGVLIDKSAMHAMISAVIYLDYQYGMIRSLVKEKKHRRVLEKIARLNAYVISRHHGRIENLKNFFDDLKNGYGEKVLSILREGKLNGYKLENIDDRDFAVRNEYRGCDYFYCRFVYSVLVACDYYATSEYKSGMEMKHFGSVDSAEKLIADYESSTLQQSIRLFEKNTYDRISVEEAGDINDLRSMMFLEAEQSYLSDPDERVYFAEMPTGSGKSNMAFNISMRMVKNGARKIFYIYPFNTLVEQNRSTMQELFSDENYYDIAVVNSLTPIKYDEKSEDSGDYYERALLDRQFLNYPLVLSTHVSFFDMLFGTKRESAYGFYQLCDAVIVLDEIQSYRNEIWGEMMIMLQECARLLNMKIIIMSATLPDLTYLSGDTEGVIRLIKDVNRYFESPFFRDRVKISTELLRKDPFSLESLMEHILQNHGKDARVLVEFMYKKTADEFYRLLKMDERVDVPLMCITGDDSIFEREKILKPIKNGKIKECILISTQVLEAGADIDMDVGYKNISRLDSEEQFLGRINRSCRKEGIAYFFLIDDPQRIYKDDFRIDPELTLYNPEMEYILSRKDFHKYYTRVMDVIMRNHMGKSNEEGIEEFERNELGVLDFMRVAKRLQLIEDDSLAQDVFLSRKLVSECGDLLDGTKIWNEYKDILKDENMLFAEKKVKLSEVRVRMAPFIYQIRPKFDLYPDDEIGSLMFYENGEDFFKTGRLDRDKLERNDSLFY